MSPTRKSTRFAHSDGYTHLCFEHSGRYLLTCGNDGDVRIWDGLEDSNPKSIDVGEITYAVVIHEDRVFASSDENSILAYAFPNTTLDGLIARFSAPVSHMCLSESGNELLAGSRDFSIKYIHLTDNNFKVFLGHEAPILSVALDHKLHYGASSSCDGTVRIWNLDKQTCIKSWASVCPTSNDFSTAKVLCRICWQPPSANFLAIPMGKTVKFFKRETWEENFTLDDESISSDINVISFSKCGQYLAAACLNGAIFIWNVDTGKCIERLNHEKGITICSLEWNPNGNGDIAYCDIQGKLGGFEGILQLKELPSQKLPVNEKLALFQDAENEDDDDNSFSISKIKAETVGTESFFEDDLSDEETKTKDVAINESEKLKTQVPDSESVSNDLKLHDLQRPFQPGSTPVYYQHRFMMWNSVGFIRSYNTEEENSIDIEFHDIAVHHSMHLDNFLNHTIANLSTTAVVLACQAQLEVPSKLVCMHFGSWDNSKEWTVDMPEGENIEALSVSQDWVAAVTSQRQVRIFSIGSVQRYIWSLPGPVVAMASFMDQLVIIYHHALGSFGDQCLSMMLINLKNGKATVEHHPLSLSPKSTLSWIGYTDEGSTCTVDSSGAVRLLSNSFGNTWIQIADTKKHVKGQSDHYFVVGISESQQQIRCILCKGSRYPRTLPHPTVTVLPFQIPLCEMSCEKSQLEETYMKQSLLLDTLTYLEDLGFDTENATIQQAATRQKETLMKLFALACKSDREFRALELSHMMDSYHTVQLAIKYASQLRHLQLAQKLGEVAYQKMESEVNPRVPLSELKPESSARLSSEKHFAKRKAQNEKETIDQEDDQADDDDDAQDSMLETQSPAENSRNHSSPAGFGRRHNPFKVSLVRNNSKGIHALDEMKTLDNKKTISKSSETQEHFEKPITTLRRRQSQLFVKQRSEKQPNQENVDKCELPQPPTEPKTGFQLWLESNRETLKLDESDSLAVVKAFKSLPVEEKQMWNEKAAKLKSSPLDACTLPMPKRKLDEGKSSEKKKLCNFDKSQKCDVSKNIRSEDAKTTPFSAKSKLKEFKFK